MTAAMLGVYVLPLQLRCLLTLRIAGPGNCNFTSHVPVTVVYILTELDSHLYSWLESFDFAGLCLASLHMVQRVYVYALYYTLDPS